MNHRGANLDAPCPDCLHLAPRCGLRQGLPQGCRKTPPKSKALTSQRGNKNHSHTRVIKHVCNKCKKQGYATTVRNKGLQLLTFFFFPDVPILLAAEKAPLLQLALQDEQVGERQLVHQLARRTEVVVLLTRPRPHTAHSWYVAGVSNSGM